MSKIDPPAPPNPVSSAQPPPPPTPTAPHPTTTPDAGAGGAGAALGGIEVTTSFFALAFLLLFFPAKVTINDGTELQHGWGTRVYPIAAGRHSVTAWCPYLFVFKIGVLTQEVDVRPGQVTAIRWRCPWLVFLPGVWTVLGERPLTQQDLAGAPAAARPAPPVQATPPPPIAAGWQPDPQRQAVYRFWDGQAWTSHTSNGQGT